MLSNTVHLLLPRQQHNSAAGSESEPLGTSGISLAKAKTRHLKAKTNHTQCYLKDNLKQKREVL
jgi:hypothetical protein